LLRQRQIHGHWFTATSLPAAKPSLSAGTRIQPSLRVSAVKDKYPDPSGSAIPPLQVTGITSVIPMVDVCAEATL
jgi:hypothetical protein